MEFPVSGVEVWPIVPVLVGFVIAVSTTPAGVSGAFLLLPFQFSVLNFTAPAVTPTNLLYNVLSTPASILSYRRLGAVDWTLIRLIVSGAGPGIVVGAILRVTIFDDATRFKLFAGIVLVVLGVNLVAQAVIARGARGDGGERWRPSWVTALGAGAGLVGGVYGISGGSIIAPILAGVFRIPVKRVAPAALVATLLTSTVGVISFEVLGLLASNGGMGRRPDWLLALLFAAGGAAGGYVGAHINARSSEKWLKLLLGLLAVLLAVTYIEPAL